MNGDLEDAFNLIDGEGLDRENKDIYIKILKGERVDWTNELAVPNCPDCKECKLRKICMYQECYSLIRRIRGELEKNDNL